MGTLKRSLSPSSTSSAPTSKRQKMDVDLSPLPPSELTLALPALLTRPPAHPQHAAGLALSRSALRQLLSTPSNLSTEAQSRAWVQLAELSIQSLPLIPPNSDEEDNTIGEIDRALSKALNLAPVTQRSIRAHVTLLQVQMAAGRGQGKFALKMLSRLLSGFTTSDEPAIIYATRLAKIQLSLSAPRPPPTTTATEDDPPRTPSADKDPALTDLHAALDGIRDLRSLADKAGQGHEHVSLLSCVLRVGVVVTRGLWSEAESAVRDAEEALGLSYPESPRPGEVRRTSTGNTAVSGSTASEKGKEKEREKEETFVMFEDAFEATCAAHALLYAVVAYTHIGDAQGAAYRLSHLHALLDEGVLSAFPDGVAEIPLPTGPPLHVRTTPPRILFALGYLVSASAKRDPVGRKPKRATFAQAGLDNLEEKEGPGFEWPVWMSVQDVEDAGYAMIRVRADLLSEMAGVSIHRNDFVKADEMLDKLIALTRTHGLWDRYAPRVTLHHAHLAHARLDHERALICYDTAAYLGARGGAGAEGDFVALAARAGAVLLRVGLLPPDGEEEMCGEGQRQSVEEAEAREEEEVVQVVVPKGKGKAKGGPKKRKGAPRKAKGKAKAVVELEDEEPTASTSTPSTSTSAASAPATWTRAQIIEEAERVSKACAGQGGTLEMVGAVVKAVVSAEILRSKAHLRRALTLATSSGSNHTRAALLALGAAHYARTDPPHALDALRGADVLAAGLGAVPKPSDVDSNATGGGGAVTGLGNVALRLWCGERKLELFRRAGPGESERAKRQEERNGVFREALEALRAQVHHR